MDLFEAIDQNNPGLLHARLALRARDPRRAAEPLDRLRNGAGQSLVTAAAAAGHSHLLRVLRQHHMSMDAPDDTGWTPAHYAAARGDDAMVLFLRAEGASLETPDASGWAPLHVAAANNRASAARALCAAAVDPLRRGRHGETAAIQAASGGYNDVLQVFREAFPESLLVQADRDGPRASSAGSHPAEPVELPEAVNASVRHWRQLEQHMARQGSRAPAEGPVTDALGRLTEQTPGSRDILVASDHSGNGPVHHAAYHGREGTLRWLHSVGVSLDLLNLQGNTPAHLAAIRGQAEVLGCLIQLGVDVTTPNHDGLTPSQLAAWWSQTHTLAGLVEAGIPMPTSVHAWPEALAPEQKSRMQQTVDAVVMAVAAREFLSGTEAHLELAEVLRAPVVRPGDPAGTAVRRAVRDVYAGDWRGRLPERPAHALRQAQAASRVAVARSALLHEAVFDDPGEVSDVTTPRSARSDAERLTAATGRAARSWQDISAGGDAPPPSPPCSGCSMM